MLEPKAQLVELSRPAAVLATDSVHVAYVSPPSNSILVSSLGSAPPLAVELSNAHQKAVTALCMWLPYGNDAVPESEEDWNSEGSKLVSASRDRIMLWDVRSSFESAVAGSPPTPQVQLSADQGSVEALAVDETRTMLTACVSNAVHVIEVSTGQCLFRVEGHTGTVTSVAFCLHNPEWLITTAEDRTFKVWDLRQGVVIYKSSILCAAALTSLALDPSFPRFAIGAADGVLRIFDLSTPACRQIQLLDVGLMVEKKVIQAFASSESASPSITSTGTRVIRSSVPSQISRDPELESEGVQSFQMSGSLAGGAVATLLYSPILCIPHEDSSPLAYTSANLLVGMPGALAVINTRTYELDLVHSFQTPDVAPEGSIASALSEVVTARAYSANHGYTSDGELLCCIASAFNPAILALRWNSADHQVHEQSEETEELSVFPSGSIPEGSPLLRGEFVDRAATQAGTSGRDQQRSNKKGVLKDQPVTFHTKIKSSGYGSSKPWTPSKPGSAKPNKAASRLTKGGKGQPSSGAMKLCQQYPVDCDPPINYQAKNVLPGGIPLHSSAIVQLSYSRDGARLATASIDKTARVVRLPLSRYAGDGTDFIAHTGAVNSVSWSHDGSFVLTSGADRAAHMWNSGKADPALSFTHCERPFVPGDSRPNPAFNTEVKAACFMYLDRFVVLASGGKIYLYKYKLAPDDNKNDLVRLQQNVNKYRLVGSFTSSSQSITGITCVNAFLSNVVLCAGSNRSIEVLDLGTSKWVRAFEDTHSRPAHTILLNGASPYASHSQTAYEIFATSACDSNGGSVKLWDLRARRCVHTLCGHVNRQHRVGVAFSPCLRYLATGGEDKAAVLYDLRMGTPLHRLREGHTDVVSDVDFHPLHPQTATACFDGRIRFFSDA